MTPKCAARSGSSPHTREDGWTAFPLPARSAMFTHTREDGWGLPFLIGIEEKFHPTRVRMVGVDVDHCKGQRPLLGRYPS